MSVGTDRDGRGHILSELGLSAVEAGEELHGTAEVTPHMHAPGTPHLRTSVLAAWADNLTGLLAARVMNPRVPVTIELDVHLYAPGPAAGTVRGIARTVKAGRSIFVAGVDFVSGDGEPVAMAAGSFMLAPDPAVRLPARLSIDAPPPRRRLAVPLAERAGCRRGEPGTAVLHRSEDGLNSSRTVHGGLLALVAEEAALSLAPGDTVASLGLRYLQPVRVGPVVATAHLGGGLGRAVLRDSGSDDRLSVIATIRTFGR
ncbi:hotdog domain-containing protein [Actinomadura sp. WMMB 499]|uniref:PaaI family thioesterase n=1 Tax=Actinomadura sp. WMMB 499 TaxID=1219491 RepID=UPI001C3FCBA6|nr:hotdog domain-containing protein [Actinomadura sp. WMMB 499]